MKFFFIFLVRVYQYTLGALLRPSCRFYPSCSEYCILALKKHGVVKGIYLTFKRLIKCGPWCQGGVDFP